MNLSGREGKTLVQKYSFVIAPQKAKLFPRVGRSSVSLIHTFRNFDHNKYDLLNYQFGLEQLFS